jgi:hypothetical protein
MKKLTIFILLIFCGSLATYYGIQRESSLLTGLGLAAAGVGIVILGADALSRRESIEQDEAGYVSTYRGCSAILIGILWVMVGLIVSISGLVVLIRQQKFLLEWLGKHPGLALIALGLVLLAYGGQELLGSEEQRSSALAILGSLPARVFGLVLVLASLTLFAAGVLEILLPTVFQSLLTALQRWWQGLPCQIQPAYCEQ